MSFAFTPSYVFDGTNTDNATEGYSSGDDVYDDFGIDEIGISSSFVTIDFKDSASMTAWRNSDRSVQFEYTGSGSKGWEGTFDLTSNEEFSVNTTYNYIAYSQYALHGNYTDGGTMADDVASNGTGSSILNINDLG